MTKDFLMDMAGLNFPCPKCNKTIVYELKTMLDVAKCDYCNHQFSLDKEAIEARARLIQLIEIDAKN